MYDLIKECNKIDNVYDVLQCDVSIPWIAQQLFKSNMPSSTERVVCHICGDEKFTEIVGKQILDSECCDADNLFQKLMEVPDSNCRNCNNPAKTEVIEYGNNTNLNFFSPCIQQYGTLYYLINSVEKFQ